MLKIYLTLLFWFRIFGCLTKRFFIQLNSQWRKRNRRSTDVCCTIFGAIFGLTMFIVACTMWNRGTSFNNLDNFYNKFFNFNTNGKGVQCKMGESVFSNNPYNYDVLMAINSRIAYALWHVPEDSFQVKGFAFLKTMTKELNILNNPKISSPFDYTNFKNTLFWSALTTLGLGILWMTISYCFPKLAPIIAHIAGAIVLITLGVLVLVLWDE